VRKVLVADAGTVAVVVADADADGNGDGGRSGVRLSACAVSFLEGELLEACVSLGPGLVDLDIGIRLFLSDVCWLISPALLRFSSVQWRFTPFAIQDRRRRRDAQRQDGR
jgi:hypothetical protein